MNDLTTAQSQSRAHAARPRRARTPHARRVARHRLAHRQGDALRRVRRRRLARLWRGARRPDDAVRGRARARPGAARGSTTKPSQLTGMDVTHACTTTPTSRATSRVRCATNSSPGSTTRKSRSSRTTPRKRAGSSSPRRKAATDSRSRTRRLARSIQAGRLLSIDELETDDADNGIENVHPHVNRICAFIGKLRQAAGSTTPRPRNAPRSNATSNPSSTSTPRYDRRPPHREQQSPRHTSATCSKPTAREAEDAADEDGKFGIGFSVTFDRSFSPTKLKVSCRIAKTITDEIESKVEDPQQPALL